MTLLVHLGAFFWGVVLPLAIQGGLLLLVGLLADRLLPRTIWPELRLAVGTVLSLKLLLPPSWASPSAWLAELPRLPAPELGGWAQHQHFRGVAITVALCWLCGVLGMYTLGAWRRFQLSRIWQKALPAGEEMERVLAAVTARLGRRHAPLLRIYPGLPSPCVFGLWRPRILLPPGLSPQMAEHALLHEIVHVRRGDLWLSAFLGLLRGFYFFHPLVHLAARRLAALRELCCDREVARILGEEREAYRKTLLSFAAAHHRSALAALQFRGGSSLLERLRALERAERDRPFVRRGLTTLGAALALACALPVAVPAESSAAEVAEWIVRPPGCLQLRFLVMEKMAQEQRLAAEKNKELP